MHRNTKLKFGTVGQVARELARCKLDLVGIQETEWDKGGTVRPRDYNFFSMEEETKINWEQVICTPQNSVSS